MAESPGGVEEGRVSIRVVPDTSRFAADLKADLKKIAAEISFAIKVDLDNSGLDEKARLAADEAQAAAGTISIKTSIDRNSLKSVTRDLAKFGSSISSNLSGLLRGATFAGLGLSAAGAVPSILTLSGSLTSLVGVVTVIPGVLAGLGITFGVLKLGAAGFSKSIQRLTPDLNRLKAIVNANLFKGFNTALENAARVLMPQLSKGVQVLSVALSGFLNALVGSIQDLANFGEIGFTFSQVAKSVRLLTPAIAPFVEALGSLVAVGAQFLPSFATTITKAAKAFDGFIQGAVASGQIEVFIRTALTGFGQLFSVLKSVGSILAGVVHAAQAAGGGTLAALATFLQQIASVVNSENFQLGLSGVFAGLQTGAKALGSALPAVGRALVSLSGPIADFATVLGQVLAAAITAIVPAIIALAPALDRLIGALGPALVTAINAVAPALEKLAQFLADNPPALAAVALGVTALVNPLIALAGVTGLVIANWGTIGTFFQTKIVPAFQTVANAVQPIIQAFTSVVAAARNLATILTPIVLQIVAIFVQNWPQIRTVIQQVFSTVQSIIVAELTIIATAFKITTAVIGFVWAHFGSQILGTIRAVLPAILTTISGVLNIIQGVFRLFTDLLKGNWSGAWADIKQIASGAIQVLQGAIREGLAVLKGIAVIALHAFVLAFQALGPKILDALGDLKGLLVQAGEDLISGLITGIERATLGPLAGALNHVTSFIKSHKGPPSVDKILLVPAGQQIIAGLIAGMQSQLPALEKSLGRVTSAIGAPDVFGGSLDGHAGSSAGGASVIVQGDVGWSLEEFTRAVNQGQRDAATVNRLQALLVG